MQVFILFKTDVQYSKRSRVFCGAFSSFNAANQAAKDNNLYTSDSQVLIEAVDIDVFGEV